jgi:hypothetical protein
MERAGDRQKKMEGYCSTGQSPHWAVVPMEEEAVNSRRFYLPFSHIMSYFTKMNLHFIFYLFIN